MYAEHPGWRAASRQRRADGRKRTRKRLGSLLIAAVPVLLVFGTIVAVPFLVLIFLSALALGPTAAFALLSALALTLSVAVTAALPLVIALVLFARARVHASASKPPPPPPRMIAPPLPYPPLPPPVQFQQQEPIEERLKKELEKLPLVRYVPPPEDSTAFNEIAPPEWLEKWVPSDLPSVCIESFNASCNICLQDFEEPPLRSQALGDNEAGADESEATSPPQSEPEPEPESEPEPDSGSEPPPEPEPETETLRQLACRHVFHQLCIDAYLETDETSQFRCPVCHQGVLDPPRGEDRAPSPPVVVVP